MDNYIFISIQDHTGDSKLKLQWDKNDNEARDFAQKEFERLINEGYRIFEVKRVFGIFKTKGEEIKAYDPNSGIIYYEKGETEASNRKFSLQEVEVDSIKYEEPKKFDPKENKVSPERSYVATKPLRAG